MHADPGAEVPGYPTDLEHQAVLADDRLVDIRPIRPGDTAEIRRALATADAKTLHARFLGAPPHSETAIRRLVEVDYVNRLALVAIAPDGTGVAVARYEHARGSDTAEVAVVVHPGWRRVGLGSLLLRDLGGAALRRGIRKFSALALADNRPVLGLLRASGLTYTLQIANRTSEIVILLDTQSQPPA